MEWDQVKNLLCVRADNMGDVLMTSPGLRALKAQNHQRKITLLTSSSGARIAKFIPEVDDILVFDLPWVKVNQAINSRQALELIKKLQNRQFEASVIFTNFSQNPLPSAMLCYLVGIPKRLGYCRENPYELLTDWVPDKEPFLYIKHAVQRQLFLVSTVGAQTDETRLSLKIPPKTKKILIEKLKSTGIDLSRPWLIVHLGASEAKRRYPDQLVLNFCKNLSNDFDFQIVLTGLEQDQVLADKITKIGKNVFSLVTKLGLDELIALISKAPVLVSANTGPVHIASAVNTPVVVLYAQTNPEHTPWGVKNEVLYFSIPRKERSKNQMLEYIALKTKYEISPEDITKAVLKLYRK